LFTTVYDKLVKREGDPTAATLLLGADSTPIQGEKALYDLALWSRQYNALADYLLNTPTSELAARLLDDEGHPEIDAWEEWRRRFQEHLQQYGYSIYDLDFAKPLPMDEPLPLLELLKLFIQGEGVNPHERQQKLATQREAEEEAALSRVKGLKLRLFRWTLRLAQSFSVMREDSIFDIGLGYPVLRQILRQLGVRLVNAGAIADAGDIYWLKKSEVENAAVALDRDGSLENLMGRIEVRKADWRAKQLVQPPIQLPPKERIMGIKMDAFMPVSADEQTEETLKGVAASSGRITANACVLHSSEEFGQMKPGDILVAEITTPAWTPLFAMAAGVVTDIGGPLSHGSIVAREYGIPAVLGTGIATRVIQSGQQITVDGDAGIVTLILGHGENTNG
jgi:pyruvate,water dikinase